MRLLFLIESFGVGGGAEQALAHLAPELVRKGLEVEVAVLWPPLELVPELAKHGIRVHRLDYPHGARWNLPRALARLARPIGTFRPEIIHAHLFFPGMYVGAYPTFGLPVLKALSLHNMDYDVNPPKSTRDQLRKFAHGMNMRHRIDLPVAVSRSVADHYKKQLGVEEVEVIPNSIPTDIIRPGIAGERASLLRQFGVLDPSAFVVVMPGRIVKQKGHRDLVEAMAILESREESLEIVMVGRGPLEADIAESIRSRHLQHRIHINPIVPNSQLMELLDVADAVVMPSLHEGFGIVAAEAMAMEKPLLASAIGPLMEFVRHEETGLLVRPGAPEELAAGLSRLLHDPGLRSRLGRAARASIVETYSVPRVAQHWIELYEERLKSKASSGW